MVLLQKYTQAIEILDEGLKLDSKNSDILKLKKECVEK